jgi:hypothetical protein
MQTLHTFGTKGKSDASSIFVTAMSNGFDTFGVVPLGQHGGRRFGAGRPRKGQPRREKTSATLKSARDQSGYILRRLVRDAQDGVRDAAILVRGIFEGRVSEYAAGVEYGICNRREPTGRGSPNASKRNDWAMHRLFNPRPVKVPMPEKAPDASSAEGEEERGSDASVAQPADDLK